MLEEHSGAEGQGGRGHHLTPNLPPPPSPHPPSAAFAFLITLQMCLMAEQQPLLQEFRRFCRLHELSCEEGGAKKEIVRGQGKGGGVEQGRDGGGGYGGGGGGELSQLEEEQEDGGRQAGKKRRRSVRSV